MSKIETVKIKRLGGFIIINKRDYDPIRHELYEEPRPKREFVQQPPPPPPVDTKVKDEQEVLPETEGQGSEDQGSPEHAAGTGQVEVAGEDPADEAPTQAEPKAAKPVARKAPKKGSSKKKR